MFYIWGISGDDSGEEILLETYFNGKYILMSHRALRFQNPQISKCYAETEILGSQEQEAIKKEQNQKISWKLSTCTLLITALLWNLKEFKFLLWSSHGNSNLENAFPIQKKASDKTFAFQQSSVFNKPIFPDVKQFLNKFWNSLSLHNDTLTKSNSWTMSVNSGTATVNTLQLLKVFSGFKIDYTDCVKRTIELHACYRRTGLIDEPMYWFCWKKVLKCCSVW